MRIKTMQVNGVNIDPVDIKNIIKPRTVQLKGRTVTHNEDGSTTVFYDNGDVVEWGKLDESDLQKLKDVFDDIGVEYDFLERINVIQFYDYLGSDLRMFSFNKSLKLFSLKLYGAIGF